MSAFIERRVFVGQTLAARASLYGLRATELCGSVVCLPAAQMWVSLDKALNMQLQRSVNDFCLINWVILWRSTACSSRMKQLNQSAAL